jgi:arylsulfatase B
MRVAIGLVAWLAATGAAMAADPLPNILFIVADDLGYAELGVQGCRDIPTPNIDSIAAAGVRFTAGYVTASYCAPSRAAMMTGRYQQRFGFEYNAIGAQNLDPKVGLPVDEKTLADRLKAAGYVTGMVGKWHLGATPPYHPTQRGFDEFFGILHEGRFFAPPHYPGLVSHLRAKEPPYNQDNPLLRGRQEIQENDYLTEALAREATAFIDRHRDRPWFLYLPFNAPHSPMQAMPKDFDRFASIADVHRRVFASMVWAMDQAVGRVLDHLRAAGLEQRTLIFFISDNGGPTAELTSRNDPFSGGKGSLLEGGIRVPMLMRWPGRVPAGRVYERPVVSMDIAATALAAAGAVATGLDGVDLLPFITGAASGDPHEALYWRMGAGQQIAMRQGDWKLYQRRGEAIKLFDLASDPAERNDCSAAEHERLRSMADRFQMWNGTLKAPIWTPGDAGRNKR